MTLIHTPKLHPATAKTLAQRASYRRVFNGYMERPCAAHDAATGQPCWSIPRDGTRKPSLAVCGARVTAALKASRRAAREGRVVPLTKAAS